MKTLTINDKTSMGKMLISILKKFESDGIVTFEKRQSGIDKSLQDIKEGRVYKAKSVKDLMSKI